MSANVVMALRRFLLAAIQLKVVEDKCENLRKAACLIRIAKERGSKIVVLPECFNSPYGVQYFKEYSEEIPDGDTCRTLCAAARENEIYVVGGSHPEREGCRYYNTCTVFSPSGDMVAKYRKAHLYDIDIPDGVTFKESNILSPGSSLATFQTEFCKVGLGICYDLRFEEIARLYSKQNCDMVIYPGSFNLTTGPMHWDVLLRTRAIDNQIFVAGVAGAADKCAKHPSYGHSIVINPWGKTITKAEYEEAMLYADINLDEIKEVRQQIPVTSQRRNDMYETIYKICGHCSQPCAITPCCKK